MSTPKLTMTTKIHQVNIAYFLRHYVFYVSLLVVLIINGCNKSSSDSSNKIQQSEQESPKTTITLTSSQLSSIGVKTVPVAVHTVGTPLELPGKVVPQPDQEAYVTSLISGRIEKVMVNEGDHVTKGEPLVTISGSKLGTLIADLQNTRLEFNRQKRLMDHGVGIKKQLQDARIAYSSAQQQLRAIGFSAGDIKKLATGQQILDAMPIRSPIDGVVLDRMAVTGGPVSSGEKLFYVVTLKPVWVQANAYEQDLEKIKTGQSAEIHATVSPSKRYSGKIRNIVPKINSDDRTASVIIELPNKTEALKPGMYTTVNILTGAKRQPAIPVQAVQVEGESTFVIVAENDTTFHKVTVSAPADGVGYVAVPNLETGTKVVTKGAFQIISAMQGIEADED